MSLFILWKLYRMYFDLICPPLHLSSTPPTASTLTTSQLHAFFIAFNNPLNPINAVHVGIGVRTSTGPQVTYHQPHPSLSNHKLPTAPQLQAVPLESSPSSAGNLAGLILCRSHTGDTSTVNIPCSDERRHCSYILQQEGTRAEAPQTHYTLPFG